MKLPVLLLLALAVPACASPVHIALKVSAGAENSASGFVTLSQVADLSGGEKAARLRLARVTVARAPLPGDVRLLSAGDITLKLRQAGFHPGQDAVLEGAKSVSVAGGTAPPDLPAAAVGGAGTRPTIPVSDAGAAIVHRGDIVTILVQDGLITITAKGEARGAGAAGQSIPIHREGVASPLTATVIDAQTVRLEL